MNRFDKIALILSLCAILAAFLVADKVFEQMSHIEDEIAFVWQAQVLAEGELTLPSPEHPKSYLVPFVIDYNGHRFGKYPLGWPVLLSFGIRLGIRSLINPLLAGLAVWLTYLLGKRVWDEKVGLIAVVLTLTSPFFLLNSGNLLSHPFSLVLSAALTLFWLDNFWEAGKTRWLKTITIGLVLGTLAITRPLTAVGIAIPFAVHGLALLLRGNKDTRKHVLVVGLITLGVASLHFFWQAAASGDPLKNLYTLWWEYDKVGFGESFGRSGHTLAKALKVGGKALRSLASNLFGWGTFSWIFLPLGLIAIRRNRQAWLVTSLFPSLVLIHSTYWIANFLYGPRYFSESLPSLTLLTAAGIVWLGGKMPGETRKFSLKKAKPFIMYGLVGLLLGYNLAFYLPNRLKGMFGLYSIQRSMLDPFLTEEAQALAPALIIVHPERWMGYGGLLELQDAFLDQPIIFAYRRGRKSDTLLTATIEETGRTVYHYYPDEPGVFYSKPRLSK